MNQRVISFKDFTVYKNLYHAAIIVNTKIIPKLPDYEKNNLKSQLRRASTSPCALIAEGYAKKHQRNNWTKYINEAIGECNEMMVHLSFVKDLYFHLIQDGLCIELIEIYNISGKQLYRLGESWKERAT